MSSEPTGEAGDAEFLGVRLTSPEKVMYPGQGATKRMIAEYYARHADRVLPFVANRPLSLVRCPSGRGSRCFFQRHHTASVPAGLDAVEIEEKDGTRAPYLILRRASGLIAATQAGALELHPWGARDDRLDRPERIVFDLDPDPDTGFDAVRSAARELRDVLGNMNLSSFPLLTGGKGIHVTVPIVRRNSWQDVKLFSRGLAGKLAATAPRRYVATASKAKRKGRIFIDWLRNERGATAIAPYSLRARRDAPVAVPVGWDELDRFQSAAAFTLGSIGRRLQEPQPDAWRDYFRLRQSLTRAHLDSTRID